MRIFPGFFVACVAGLAAFDCAAFSVMAGATGMTVAGRPYPLGISDQLPITPPPDLSGYAQVSEGGAIVPGCEHLSGWAYIIGGEGPDFYQNTMRCTLPASVPGWHEYDVAYRPTQSAAPEVQSFKLYVSPVPLPTAVIAQRRGFAGSATALAVDYQILGPNLSPPWPAQPDLRPTTRTFDRAAMTMEVNASRDGTCDDFLCFVFPKMAGRQSLVARFGGNALYAPSSSEPVEVVTVSRHDDANLDGKADILWRNGAGRVAQWFMDGATQVGGREIIEAGTGWSLELVGDTRVSPRAWYVARHLDGRFYATDGQLLAITTGINPILGPGWHAKLVGKFRSPDLANDVVFEHDDGQVLGLLPAGTGWHPAIAADFDGSGTDDLLWRHDDGSVAIWTMSNFAQAGGARLIGPGTGWKPAFAGFFDGDRCADILWTHDDGRVAMWIMAGIKQVGAAALLPANTGFRPIAVGDLDGDGRQDIVWERADGRTAFWLMDGTRQVGAGDIFAAGSGWKLVKLADYDGDGRLDYLAMHSDGRVAVGLFDGVRTFTQTVILPGGTGYTPIAD
jgi:hypothetical protein